LKGTKAQQHPAGSATASTGMLMQRAPPGFSLNNWIRVGRIRRISN